MEFILEIILQFFGELLLQIVGEALFELGLHSIAEVIKRPLTGNPWLASLGYVLLGSIAGAISLLLLPVSLIHNNTLRWINLLLTPIFAGMTMVAIGVWRARRGQEILRINRFVYGFLFALTMALIRFTWGH